MKNTIYLFVISMGFIFASCMRTQKKVNIVVSEEMKVDTSQGSCPYLTKDNEGNIVLSWIKKMDTSTSVFCYAVSKDGGTTFGKVIDIPGSNQVHPHGENMPKIIFKPNGEIIAAWPEANPNAINLYSDRIFYATSSDNGLTWSAPENLVKDSSGYDQRYFDMAILPNGEAAMIWLDNRKKSRIAIGMEGSALFIAETNGDSGFQNEQLLSEPCCPCCRTDLFVDSKKDVHIVYRAILRGNIRDIIHLVSEDNGKTFSTPIRISEDNWVIDGCPHTGPSMTENKDGLQFTWFAGGSQAGVYYCSSDNNDNSFSPREEVSGVSSRHSQIISVADNDLAVVWDETFTAGNISSNRIGIEIRNAEGAHPVSEYITSQTGDAIFPVIKNVGENAVLVAYTESLNDRNYVRYKVVEL